MNEKAASPGCPDPETISAIFDGEFEPDDAMRAHLNVCPVCIGRLADYATIRESLSKAVAAEPDDGFDARIAAYVRASSGPVRIHAKASDFRDSRMAWFFRIAALFILSGFFVYLLTDQMQTGRPKSGRVRTADVTRIPSPSSGKTIPVFSADPGVGDYVKARLVSDSPSAQQYAIDIDPMLIPIDLDDIPADGSIPVSLPGLFEQDGGGMRRIPLRGDPTSDAMLMLESIRRDLTALDVPGLSVDTESRGKSLITTIRLESGNIDMSMRRTDDSFQFFLINGDDSEDDGPVSFQIEFFCE